MATAVVDGRDHYFSRLEPIEEGHHLGPIFASVKRGFLGRLEKMDFEMEGSFFLLDDLAEELGVILVELTVVRIWINLVLVELVVDVL